MESILFIYTHDFKNKNTKIMRVFTLISIVLPKVIHIPRVQLQKIHENVIPVTLFEMVISIKNRKDF